MPHDHHSHGSHHHGHGSRRHNQEPHGYSAWELPRAEEPTVSSASSAVEPDFDLVEKSFIDGAHKHPDPTSFLRLASVPFHASTPAGQPCYLLGYVIEDVVEVGSVMPTIGAEAGSYNVVPASRVAKQRNLYFQYWSAQGEFRLTLAQARSLKVASSQLETAPSISNAPKM